MGRRTVSASIGSLVAIYISVWPKFMWLSIRNMLFLSPRIKELERIQNVYMITLEKHIC